MTRAASPAAGWALPAVLLFALLLRIASFNGAFGSDDLVYYERALQIAHGDWRSANYNGALRYGFNLPAGLFMAAFGDGWFSANAWPLLCSLVEVAAVYAFGASAMNRRAGIAAALLLAAAPLHIAVATRIHADPVVAMFVTLGFVLLYFGLQRGSRAVLFAAGLAIGGVFWAKELAAVTWLAFLPMLWWLRGRWPLVLPVLAGTVLMLLLHGALMQVIAGNPLHLVVNVLGAVQRNFVESGQGEDAAGYYLRYLFVDVRHVGLLALLAVGAFWWVPRWWGTTGLQPGRTPQVGDVRDGFAFAALWWLGLLLVLSLFPVSLSPLRFTMKQSNYISLFLGPTAVLAGMGVAALPRRAGQALLLAAVVLGVVLGFLQQADYRAFTANSKAVAALALEQPQALIVGSPNNKALGGIWADRLRPDAAHARIAAFGDAAPPAPGQAVLAVLDRQTMTWFAGKDAVTQPLPCWQRLRTLQPQDLGWGNRLAGWLAVGPAAAAMGRLARPQAAELYRVQGPDALCRQQSLR